MSRPWLYRIYDSQQLVHSDACEGPIELGRRRAPGETLFQPSTAIDRRTGEPVHRIAIADQDEDRVSRRHARIDATGAGRVRVENLSDKVIIGLGDGRDLRPGESRELFLPILLLFRRRSVRILEASEEGTHTRARVEPAGTPSSEDGSPPDDTPDTPGPGKEHAVLGLSSGLSLYFGGEKARELADRPELLTGRKQAISILCAEIREIGEYTRDLGPERVLSWLDDVLLTLSDGLFAREGVRIESRGDELMALWGAPEARPDHADRAARAVLAMLGRVGELDARWRSIVGRPISLGVGLDSGLACVGSMGTAGQRFRYGAIGEPVQVASLTRRACTHFRTSALITRATRDLLTPDLLVRRIGLVHLMDRGPAIELFELAEPGRAGWDALAAGYEAALAAFEAGDFREATRRLGPLLNDHPHDGPTLALLARAAGFLLQKPEPFDPAFRMT